LRSENRWLFAATCLGTIATVAACGPREITATLVVQTEDAPSQQVSRTAEILAERFSEIRPTMFSTVMPTVSGHTITFTFRGESLGEQSLRPLALTRGVLTIAPADHPEEVWVTDLDIVDVRVFMTEQGPMLSLRVTPEAGGRLLEGTSKNIGRKAVTTWEGRTLISATISGAFSTQFQLPVPSVEESHVLLNVLRHGRLPAAVTSFEYRAASASGK